MHDNIKKMCDGYRCISGKTMPTKTEKEQAIAQLTETIREIREDWLAVPLGQENAEKKTRLYKKLRHLMRKERQLRDQS